MCCSKNARGSFKSSGENVIATMTNGCIIEVMESALRVADYNRGQYANGVAHLMVKYTPEQIKTFWAKVSGTDNDEQCWEWNAALSGSGYGKLTINQRPVTAHRFAWELVNGKIPDGLFACHKCDNRKCVNPNHLFLGTQKDNMRDMTNKGRRAVGAKVSSPGERNPNRKLNLIQVEEIRHKYAQGGTTYKKLAREYHVCKSMIGYIISGTNWK